MIDPFNISLNAADRVGERSRSRSVADRQYPTPMNSMSPMALPFLRRQTLRERLRSGNAYSMVYLVDHFLCGLSLDTAKYSISAKTMEKPRRRRKIHFEPFFDHSDNPELHSFPAGTPVDGTPPPPKLSRFDRDVLQVCGNLGDKVWAADFRALLQAYPQVLARIAAAVDGEIFPGRREPPEFLADLTDIWFRRGGFQHIFCGSLHKGQLKGMHYVGRYLQLQEKGLAGKLPHNQGQEEVIAGAVYTIGVLLNHKNRLLVDRRTGYALITDATELLIAATAAFKAQERSYGVCTFPVQDEDSEASYSAVFVKEEGAIVTFYPDATPENPPCQ
jgi:hypothetical protein